MDEKPIKIMAEQEQSINTKNTLIKSLRSENRKLKKLYHEALSKCSEEALNTKHWLQRYMGAHQDYEIELALNLVLRAKLKPKS